MKWSSDQGTTHGNNVFFMTWKIILDSFFLPFMVRAAAEHWCMVGLIDALKRQTAGSAPHVPGKMIFFVQLLHLENEQPVSKAARQLQLLVNALICSCKAN